MKKLLSYVLPVLLLMISFTGCTRYASNSPTPEATQLPTLALATPTLLSIEVEQPTRTPFPIMLQTATPTNSFDQNQPDQAQGTMGAPEAKNPTLNAYLQQTSVQKANLLGTPNAILTQPGMRGTFSLTGTVTGFSSTIQAVTPFPTRAPMVIVYGNPTIAIVHVVRADSISVKITNLEPNQDIRIRMGSPAAYGADGSVINTVNTGAEGTIEDTYKIPANVAGYGTIEFRFELPNGYPYYFPFYNNNY